MASEQETLPEFPDSKMILETKIQERDDYLIQIDKETEEIEKKRKMISDAKTNIRTLTREIKKLKKVKRKIHEETISSGIPSIDLNLLNDEHRDFIVSKQNIINSLMDEIESLAINDLNEDMTQITEENAEYEIKYRKNQNELELLHSQLISIHAQIRTLDAKINYTNSSINAVQQASKDSERVLSAIIQRQECTIGEAVRTNLDKRVQSLREQYNTLQNGIEEMNYQIKEMENDKINYITKKDQELEQVENIINWKYQKLAYEKEIAKTLQLFQETKQKNSINQEKITILQNRYKKLSQLAPKWKDNQNIQLIQVDEQQSIDDLIQQHSKLSNKLHFRSNQKNDSLEVLINENAKLQHKIQKRYEEFQRMIHKFNYEKVSIKQTIESSKTIAFENEQTTVDSITTLRIKKAARKTPQKSPIYQVPDKSLSRTPLKPINRIPDKSSNKTPLKPTNKTPLKPTNKTPLKPTNKTPLKSTSRTPIKSTNRTPIKTTD